ncbi:MAG: cellulose biosynthesis cyclic di-GMP-binding regulatory protein BcsB, partial [Dehalococcoidia bacterium]
MNSRAAQTRWRLGALFAAAIFGLAFGGGGSALAQTPTAPDAAPNDAPRRVTALEDLGFRNAVANGASAQLDFFFFGRGDYEIGDDSRVVVDLTHSNLLDGDQSAVAVAFNDRPLLAVPLDESNTNGGSYEIPIPADLIEPDFNRLTFTFNMTTGLFCESPANSSLFATILGSTFFEIDFLSDPPIPTLEAPNLADYPYPFFRSGYPIVAPVVIAIPDEPTPGELTSAYQLSTGLASRVAFDLDLVRVRLVSDIPSAELARSQLILVGTAARNPLVERALRDAPITLGGDGSLTRGETLLPPDAGYLTLVESPWNARYRALVVTGGTSDGVRRGVDALTLDEPSALLGGADAALLEPVIPPLEPAFQSAFTFLDAGTGESTIEGQSGIVSVAFSAPAPAPGSSGALDLVLSMPEGLDSRRSNILVELNGSTIATVQIDQEGLRRSSYRVDLPSDVLRIGPNTLRLAVNLYDTQSLVQAPCESSAPERLWITIHGDSAIQLPQSAGAATGSSLGALPFPFAGLRGLRETTFLVDSSSPESLRAGMLAVIALGRAFGAQNEFDVQPARTATPESLGDRHIVAIGVPPSTPVGQELERVLPLVIREGGSRALVE